MTGPPQGPFPSPSIPIPTQQPLQPSQPSQPQLPTQLTGPIQTVVGPVSITELGRARDQRRILLVGDFHGRDKVPCPTSPVDLSLSNWVDRVVKDGQYSPSSSGGSMKPVNILIELNSINPLNNVDTDDYISDVANDKLICLSESVKCADRVVIPVDVRLSTTTGCWAQLIRDLGHISRKFLERQVEAQEIEEQKGIPIEKQGLVPLCIAVNEELKKPYNYTLPDGNEYKLNAIELAQRLQQYTTLEDEFIQTGQLVCKFNVDESKQLCDLPGVTDPRDRGILEATMDLYRERSRSFTPKEMMSVINPWFKAANSNCTEMTAEIRDAFIEMDEFEYLLMEHLSYLQDINTIVRLLASPNRHNIILVGESHAKHLREEFQTLGFTTFRHVQSFQYTRDRTDRVVEGFRRCVNVSSFVQPWFSAPLILPPSRGGGRSGGGRHHQVNTDPRRAVHQAWNEWERSVDRNVQQPFHHAGHRKSKSGGGEWIKVSDLQRNHRGKHTQTPRNVTRWVECDKSHPDAWRIDRSESGASTGFLYKRPILDRVSAHSRSSRSSRSSRKR